MKKTAPAPVRTVSSRAQSEQWRDLTLKILDENKGEEIVAIDLKNKCSFADFMVVASGRSGRHVASLADHVVDALRKTPGGYVLSVEGQQTGDWVLIDAGDVIVHIFRPEIRQFYNIEKMWAIPLVSE